MLSAALWLCWRCRRRGRRAGTAQGAGLPFSRLAVKRVDARSGRRAGAGGGRGAASSACRFAASQEEKRHAALGAAAGDMRGAKSAVNFQRWTSTFTEDPSFDANNFTANSPRGAGALGAQPVSVRQASRNAPTTSTPPLELRAGAVAPACHAPLQPAAPNRKPQAAAKATSAARLWPAAAPGRVPWAAPARRPRLSACNAPGRTTRPPPACLLSRTIKQGTAL